MLDKFKFRNKWNKLEQKIKITKKKEPSDFHIADGTDSTPSASAAIQPSTSTLPGDILPAQLVSAQISDSSLPTVAQHTPLPRYSILGDQAGQPPGAEAPTIKELLDVPPSVSAPSNWMNNVLKGSLKTLKVLAVLTGAPRLEFFVESFSERQGVIGKGDLETYLNQLMGSIEPLTKEGAGSDGSQKLKDALKGLCSSLAGISEQVRKNGNSEIFLERAGREITQVMDSFMVVNCISGIIKLTDTLVQVEKHVLGQRIQTLPHVDAAYNDYESKKKSGACFEGTREALLDEIAEWISALRNLQIYLLSGIAGIGKSTIAFTIAERAERIGYLGASFFFSRDEAERSNAKKLFTTIAYQLCHFSKEFAQAIENALLTERGSAATAKDPVTQLDALILEPLRDIVKSRSGPIVIVVDALDECDDRDAPIVLAALNRLVQELACFKVIVTTRPQPHLPPVPSAHKVFYLQNIEDKIVDGDIQRYLKHGLSQEQVLTNLPALEEEWSVDDGDIKSLVQATGRLFIMASTLVRFILDTKAYDPRLQMEVLRADDRVSLDSLENFYNVILRCAIPPNQPMISQRFKIVIGTILVAQEPLPIRTLGQLIQPWSSTAIKAVSANLQSVIMLNNDIPRVYHKSFFDFLTDPRHCAQDLYIDVKAHHTRVAIRCFQIMNKDLKQNILNLGTPARFMDNDDGLVEENILPEQLAERIPGELRYACVYWANHIEGADMEDVGLVKEVNTFLMEHLLHWLESLSWIGRLNVAYPAVCIIKKHTESIPHLRGIISDALRFIPRFSERIRQSALHTYYSALPFTPTDCALHKSHSRDSVHGLCKPGGIPPQWDATITYFGRSFSAMHLVFSHDSSKFSSSTQSRHEMRLWDAENGMLLFTFKGDKTAVSGDFSVVAVSQDNAVSLWNGASNTPIATATQSEKVVELALSLDGSQLAVGLSNGTVCLWHVERGALMTSLEGYGYGGGRLGFSPQGHRFIFISGDGTMRLWNGGDGRLVATLDYESRKHIDFVFSHNGSRLASLVEEGGASYSLTLWDGEQGSFVGAIQNVRADGGLTISEDGSVIATGGGGTVEFYSANPLSLLGTLDVGGKVDCLAISQDILAIGSQEAKSLILYDVNTRIVTSVVKSSPRSLAISHNCTRVAIGNLGGVLYDIPLLKTSIPTSTKQHGDHVTALAFSPDCSRLASGRGDGTIELWDTNRTDAPITSHKLHSERISALAFSLNGDRFASGCHDRTVTFWNGKDSAPMSRLEHSFNDTPRSVAFSPDLLAVATKNNITLFNHKALCLVDMLENGGRVLSFSADGSLLALASHDNVIVWNIAERATVATFTTKSNVSALMFSPDRSQLAAHLMYSDDGFEFFDMVNKRTFELVGHEDLSWFPNLMNGALIFWRWNDVQGGYILGQFFGRRDKIPVLWIPREIGTESCQVGSSMLALGCFDGRVLFIRFPTTSNN